MSETPPQSSAWPRAGAGPADPAVDTARPAHPGHYGAGYGDPARHFGGAYGQGMPFAESRTAEQGATMTHDPRPSSLWRRGGERGAPAWPSGDDERTYDERRWGRDSDTPETFPEARSGDDAPRTGAATDPDYARWRAERLREFDADYDAWRRERYAQFCAEFEGWRREVQRARARSEGEPPLRLGARADGAPTENTATFFERS